MKSILILEDDDERIAAFRSAVERFGPDFELAIWHDAPAMIRECGRSFSTAALISLDHDLNPKPGATGEPGTGMDAARFLADHLPVCPVIVHSSNTNAAWSMHNEFRFSGWTVDRVGPLGTGWIESSWLAAARRAISKGSNSWKCDLPPDHENRVARMRCSLLGLGIGDALGEMLSGRASVATRRILENDLPAGPWFHTDDTEMAISIAEVLRSHGTIEQNALGKRFARRFERDPDRGYGKMTRIQLREMIAGARWQDIAANAFGGQGSMGNGAAMRVAPLGAYFFDDCDRVVQETTASAVVTHTHPEGVAGAVAVALAAAIAARKGHTESLAAEIFGAVLAGTLESQVRRKITLASEIPSDTPAQEVARLVGNGSQITAPDTVPFCIWVAAHHANNYAKALAEAICVDGDCDTNAAIVGGIVGSAVGLDGIPAEWIAAREMDENL
jgi:ADP-ribosylglycohydrolase